jgi:hypothetical protein
MPLPLSRPRSAVYSNYPEAWRQFAPYQEFVSNGTEGWAHMTADALRGLVSLPECRFQPPDSPASLFERAWGWRDARGVVALLTSQFVQSLHRRPRSLKSWHCWRAMPTLRWSN